MKWYYYLHTNGSLIGKHPYVADNDSSYFNKPFVAKVWLTDSQSRATFWQVALEALALGAELTSIVTFAKAYGLDYGDSIQMIKNTKPTDIIEKGFRIFVEEILRMDWETYWIGIERKQEAVEKMEGKTIGKIKKDEKGKVEQKKKDYSQWN